MISKHCMHQHGEKATLLVEKNAEKQPPPHSQRTEAPRLRLGRKSLRTEFWILTSPSVSQPLSGKKVWPVKLIFLKEALKMITRH